MSGSGALIGLSGLLLQRWGGREQDAGGMHRHASTQAPTFWLQAFGFQGFWRSEARYSVLGDSSLDLGFRV